MPVHVSSTVVLIIRRSKFYIQHLLSDIQHLVSDIQHLIPDAVYTILTS